MAQIKEIRRQRIYNYNRPGLDGKPREFHTELAKNDIDYKVYDDYQTHHLQEQNKGSVTARYILHPHLYSR